MVWLFYGNIAGINDIVTFMVIASTNTITQLISSCVQHSLQSATIIF